MKKKTPAQILALSLALFQLYCVFWIVKVIVQAEPDNDSGVLGVAALVWTIGMGVWFLFLLSISLTIFFKPNREEPASDKKFVLLDLACTFFPFVLSLFIPALTSILHSGFYLG